MRARNTTVVRATRRRNETFWIAGPRAVNVDVHPRITPTLSTLVS
jgi:hypothetical protein